MLSCAPVNVVEGEAGRFAWPRALSPATYRPFQVSSADADLGTRREVEEVPPEEFANAALFVLSSQVSMLMADLVRETAKLFGYKAGATVSTCVSRGIGLLIERGAACERAGMVVAAAGC